jgi:CheY-like chemotaxis protein
MSRHTGVPAGLAALRRFVQIRRGMNPTMSRIRVLVVDDDENFSASLAATLDGDTRVEVVASARDGLEALDRCADARPDVVAMDIHMPGWTASRRRAASEPSGAGRL